MNIEQKVAIVMAAVRNAGDTPPEAIPLIEMAATELLSIADSLRSIATSLAIISNQGPRQ